MRQSSLHNKGLYPPKITFFCNKNNKLKKVKILRCHISEPSSEGTVLSALFFASNGVGVCDEKVQISAQTQIICAHLQLWKKFQNISYMRQGKSFFQTVWALFLSATFYMSGAVYVQIWMIENWSRGNRLFYFLIFHWNWCPQSSDSWHLCLPSLEMLSGEHGRELVWFG